MNYAFIIKINV